MLCAQDLKLCSRTILDFGSNDFGMLEAVQHIDELVDNIGFSDSIHPEDVTVA
jgi:hypothetical protein